MEYRLKYEIDFSPLMDFYNSVGDEIQNRLSKAVNAAGNYFVAEWIKTAESRFRHSQGDYIRGIQDGVMYPYQNNPLEFRIVHSDPKAVFLEYGSAEYDMKQILQTSLKVRYSKDGHRYLVIPFRHGNPKSKTINPMPEQLYSAAKHKTPSYITGRKQEGIQQGALDYLDAQDRKLNNPDKISRNTYSWGERMTEKELRQLGLSEGDVKKYTGMYRFEKNPNITRQFTVKLLHLLENIPGINKFVNRTQAANQYSNYITFRVMSEISRGWIRPARPGMYILKETYDRTNQIILNMLADAVKDF